MNNIDPLKFVQGCDNNIPSPSTLNGEALKAFDKNKILKILKGMTQREIDTVFTAISNLIHNEVTREGLWATDKNIEELAEMCCEDLYDTCVTKLNDVMFQLD